MPRMEGSIAVSNWQPPATLPAQLAWDRHHHRSSGGGARCSAGTTLMERQRRECGAERSSWLKSRRPARSKEETQAGRLRGKARGGAATIEKHLDVAEPLEAGSRVRIKCPGHPCEGRAGVLVAQAQGGGAAGGQSAVRLDDGRVVPAQRAWLRPERRLRNLLHGTAGHSDVTRAPPTAALGASTREEGGAAAFVKTAARVAASRLLPRRLRSEGPQATQRPLCEVKVPLQQRPPPILLATTTVRAATARLRCGSG